MNNPPRFQPYDLVKIKEQAFTTTKSKLCSNVGFIVEPVPFKYDVSSSSLWKVKLIGNQGEVDYKIIHFSNLDLI